MNGQLVKSLLIEIDASTEKLRRALREGGVELDTFAQKSERTGKTSSTAADATASKQATAARAIAMTTETIARQGQVSGEAAKQLIAQGANAAFMFGPQGAIVGAIGIATLAIVTMFARARREAEETARAARDEFRKLADMDLAGVSRQVQALDTGDYELRQGLAGRSSVITRDEAVKIFQDDRARAGAEGLREERARLAAQLGGLGSNIVIPASEQNASQRAASALRRQLEAEIRAIDDAIRQVEPRLRLAKALMSQRETEVGERAANELSTAREAARQRRARERKDEEQKFADGLSRQSLAAQEAVYARFQATLKSGFSGTREDIERSFAELVQYAEEHGEQSEIAFLKRARQQALDFITAAERSQALIESLERSDLGERIAQTDARDRAGAGEAQLAAIERERDAWLAMSTDASRSEADRTKALGEAAKLQGLLEARLSRTAKERREDTKELRQQALAIGQAIDGVLQLAAAWGGVRAEVVNVLRGVVQMAANVPGLLDSLESLKKARDGGGEYTDAAGKVITTAAAAADVASTVLPIIGALSTIGAQLFGDSPAEQERKRVQRENTRAIERLTRQMSVNINVAGADWIRTRAELQRLMDGEMRGARNAFALQGDSLKRFLADAARAGENNALLQAYRVGDYRDSARIDWQQLGDIDRDLLEETAKELGITLDGTVGSFRRLMDAIDAAEGKLFEFGDNYEDQVILTDLEIQAKQITDPLERTLAKLGPALESSPLLKDLLANADLGTEAGRAAVRDSILQILETMDTGGDALDPEQVGLTRDQFLEVLGFLLGSLDDLDTQATGGQGSSLGGVSGFRGLTEAAGERMADYLRALSQSATVSESQRARIIAILERWEAASANQAGATDRGPQEPVVLVEPAPVTVALTAGEQMADFLRGILGQGGEQLQVMRAQLAELARIAATPFTLPVIPGVTVPLPASAAGTTITIGSGAISIGDVVVQVAGSTPDAEGLGLQVRDAVRDQLDEVLYRSFTRALRARGDVSIIPGVR